MRITYQQLQEVIDIMVPEEYKPGGIGALVTNISLIPRAEIQNWLKIIDNVAQEDVSEVRGICINWGVLNKKGSIPGWEQRLQSNAIFLDDQPRGGILQTGITLLHEIGHVDWRLKRSKGTLEGNWEEGDEELYCDLFAHRLMEEKYGTNVANYALKFFGSKHGLGGILNDG